MGEWVDAWETHFNLGLGEGVTDGDNSDVVNFAYNFSDLVPLFGVDDLTRTVNATIPEFKAKYYSNKFPRKNEVLTMWVQVRRGEVTSEMPHMWASTTFLAETIAMARAVLEAHCVEFKIRMAIAQDDYAAIAELDVPGTEIVIDADVVWSMREAIEADILIMAKSSFSYVAALISEGIKIYESCSYPPLSDWVIRGPKGEFDRASFERQLLQRIESR